MGRTSLPDHLHLCSLNIRGLGQMAKMHLLTRQLAEIKWDILALQETKRQGTFGETLPNGEIFYHFSQNPHHGTGFLVKSSCVFKIVGFHPVSSRLSYLDVQCKYKTLRVISAYAPTSASTDAEYDLFLADLSTVLSTCTAKTTPIVLGDFNAKLGCRFSFRHSTPFLVRLRVGCKPREVVAARRVFVATNTSEHAEISRFGDRSRTTTV